jgi:hypothetical protein
MPATAKLPSGDLALTKLPLPLERSPLRLLAGRDRRVRARSSWAYSNEIALGTETKKIPPGTLVRIADGRGKPFGVATFNVHAPIADNLERGLDELEIPVPEAEV